MILLKMNVKINHENYALAPSIINFHIYFAPSWAKIQNALE